MQFSVAAARRFSIYALRLGDWVIQTPVSSTPGCGQLSRRACCHTAGTTGFDPITPPPFKIKPRAGRPSAHSRYRAAIKTRVEIEKPAHNLVILVFLLC